MLIREAGKGPYSKHDKSARFSLLMLVSCAHITSFCLVSRGRKLCQKY
jgi:hypothetical protein